MQLVLSIFPGIDLLGRGFEAEGFCVVRGPDLLWGADVREFQPVANRFDGIIGGSPCQDFSNARRDKPSGYGVEMLQQFARVIDEAIPSWFLLENVPHVPDIVIPGYSVQRFDLRAQEVGLSQGRIRHFQYGSRAGLVLVLSRGSLSVEKTPTVIASDTRRTWSDVCTEQGLPPGFDLPGWSKRAKYRAVGNGVPIPMARYIARAIQNPASPDHIRLCSCGCGRPVHGRAKSALPACRKRLQRSGERVSVTVPGGFMQVPSR